LEAEDLVNLHRYHYVNKITIDGSHTPPFTGIALPPDWQPQGQKQEIMELSRAKYATPKAEIEDKIARWAASEYNDKGNLVQK